MSFSMCSIIGFNVNMSVTKFIFFQRWENFGAESQKFDYLNETLDLVFMKFEINIRIWKTIMTIVGKKLVAFH